MSLEEKLKELKQQRAEYGGFSFDTPDKNLLKDACRKFQITAKELVEKLNLSSLLENKILRDDVLKIIRSSKEEIGII